MNAVATATVALAPEFDVWTHADGALFVARTTLRPTPGPLSAALARAFLHPVTGFGAARQAASEAGRPTSESLFLLSQWADAGLAVEVETPGEAIGVAHLGATGDLPLIAETTERARVVVVTGLDDPALLDALDEGPMLAIVQVGEALWVGPYATPADRDAVHVVQQRIRRTHPYAALAKRLGATLVRPALPVTLSLIHI